MPEITTIRVVRKRTVQPEQFGSAMAEVEFVGNVLIGEDHIEVARQMLVDTRALVYENLGMKLPAYIVAAAAQMDKPDETATVETETGEKAKKSRGRPAGSKNTAPKKETKAAERKRLKAEAEAAAVASDDIPGDESTPNISTGGERVNPEDDVPGDDEGASEEEGGDDELTAEVLHRFITENIAAGKLTTMQAKQMQREMKVARVRDLDTPAKLAKAKTMIDSAIATNEAATS